MQLTKRMIANVLFIATTTLTVLAAKTLWEAGLGDQFGKKAAKLFTNET